jgi:endonuclease YncB( thermonuclease family)
MPFILIKGTFRTDLGTPDGDSVRFKADNDELFKLLRGRKVIFKSQNTVQLRYEGIDAIEKSATKPLATQAIEFNLKTLKGNTPSNQMPRGYILARETDGRPGRPVSLVFTGATNLADGAEINLTPSKLKQSVNYKLLKAGFAYPLFYETFFAEFRAVFVQGVQAAQKTPAKGYWPTEKTNLGVVVNTKADLKTIPPVFPKLWRRLEEYFEDGNSQGLANFKAFLEAGNERLHTLSDDRFIGFQEVVEVTSGNKVRLKYKPEDMVFRS